MITVVLLDDSINICKPNYHYTIILFPGSENYPTLKVAANALTQELQELSNCEITKNQRENGQNDWIISKSMSSLNENLTAYPGHKLPPLFNMISLKNHVSDKLHIMLYITDHLWKFEFWNIHGINNWNYTSLMGDDKLCVLRNFNLTKLFDPERAALIKSL
ncbi:unnamed protein product [Rhizophagus irregularis]|nr:unnamed protein product [Rhizophagus irregularis]